MDITKKPVEELNRTEIIKELARHAHPTWYHKLLSWSTPPLAALLAYYRTGGESKGITVALK